MRTLNLLPDAFGGRGGIAKFNRDLLTSFCSYCDTKEVVALPRNLVDPIERLPRRLNYIVDATVSKQRFLLESLQVVIKNSDFDVIVCGHINLLPLAYVIHLYSKAPLLLIIHGIEAWQPSPSRLANYLTNNVDAVLAVSETTLNRFLEWTQPKNAKFFILPNAVELEGYTPGNKASDLMELYGLHGKTVLLTLGRLDYKERYKGFDEVVEALPKLLPKHPNLVYLIAGEGPDRPRLEAKVRRLNLEKQVIFSGFIPENRKADYYRLADAFLMPSRGEGFGIVLLEAMACGIPVMGSKLDGSSEALLHGKFGVLIDPTNSEDVKAGIQKTLECPKQVPEGLDYFSLTNFEKRCHQILDSLFEEPKKPRQNINPHATA